MFKIAVYGSLSTGCYNYEIYLKGHVILCEKGVIKGRLFHLLERGYPALLPGDDDVACEILTLKDEDLEGLLMRLDKLENFSQPADILNEYEREMTNVFNMHRQAYEELPVYWFNMNNPEAQGAQMEYIPEGNWPEYMKKRSSETA